MLIKLLKYDFHASAPMFGVGYAAVLALAILTAIFNGTSDRLTAVFGTLYGGLVFAVVIVTWVALCVHFHRNLLGSEGYLMHTLPLRGRYLILSKLISAVVWGIASGVVIFVSVVILLLGTEDIPLKQVVQQLVQQLAWLFKNGLQMKSDAVAVLLEIVMALLVSQILMLMIFYFAFLVSHLVARFRGLLAAGVIVGLLWGSSFVCEKYLNIFGRTQSDLLQMGIVCVLMFLVSVALFALSAWLMEEKLNLQ